MSDTPDVRQQQKEAAQFIKDSTPEGSEPDAKLSRQVAENFKLGRSPDEESFASEREAYAELESRHEARQADKAAEAEQEAAQQRQADEAEVRQHERWDEEDKSTIADLEARAVQFHKDRAIFNAAVQEAQRLQAEGQRIPHDVLTTLHQAHARLQKEEAELRTGAQMLVGVAKLKQAKAEQTRFQNEFKELKDEGFRKRLIDWAVEHEGIPRHVAEAARDPATVGPYVARFKRFEAEQAKARKSEKVAQVGQRLQRHINTNAEPLKSSKDAMERLKKTGSIRDAYAWLELRHAERHG